MHNQEMDSCLGLYVVDTFHAQFFRDSKWVAGALQICYPCAEGSSLLCGRNSVVDVNLYFYLLLYVATTFKQ